MLNPEFPDKAFCGTDGRFAVPVNALVNGDCHEPDFVVGLKEAVEKKKKGGAVLAAAQGNGYAVARHDLLLRGDRFEDPVFEVGDKVDATQGAPGMPLVDHGRFPAEGAGRDIRTDGLYAHMISPRGRSG